MIENHQRIPSLIQEKMLFVKTLGYSFAKASYDESLILGKVLNLYYEKNFSDLLLELSYCSDSQKIPKNLVPRLYRGNKDLLFITHWLKKHHLEDKLKCSIAQTPGLTEEAFITKFCNDFKHLCENELNDIITGKTWEDIPFDWGDYK